MKICLKRRSNVGFHYHKPLVLICVLCCYSNCGVFSQSVTALTESAIVQSSVDLKNHSMFTSSCQHAPGLVPGDRQRIEECCNKTVEKFETFWGVGNMYLTSYLQTLKDWQCPQFPIACQERLFAFNEFTRLVYDYFCDYELFVNKCIVVVNNSIDNAQFQTKIFSASTSPVDSITTLKSRNVTSNITMSNNITWLSLVKELSTQHLTVEQLMIPCVQVALYQAEEAPGREYHEIIRLNLPSCGVTWCGYNGNTLKNRIISSWTCMSSSCRAKMISIVVICGLLGLTITFANFTVILVHIKNPVLRHSQGIYKLSLAFADLIIGLVVFPTFISSLLGIAMTRHHLGNVIDVTGYFTNKSMLYKDTVQVREASNWTKIFFTTDYLNAVGFFTVVSFLVSIYTLTVAGIDRLQVVYKPLKYNIDTAKSRAKKLCIAIWLIASFLSFSPMFVPTLNYNLAASVLVSSGGSDSLILYAIGFIVPLLAMWILSYLTYYLARKHSMIKNKFPTGSKNKFDSVESQLTKTLSLMVLAFSLSIVPAAVVILASLFATTIYAYIPRTLDIHGYLIYGTFEFASIIILACNSLWNFFIYSVRSAEFRKSLKILCRNMWMKTKQIKCNKNVVVCVRRIAHNGQQRFSSISFSSKISSSRTTESTFRTKLSSVSSAKSLPHSSDNESASTARSKSQVKIRSNSDDSNKIAETSFGSNKRHIAYAYSQTQPKLQTKCDDIRCETKLHIVASGPVSNLNKQYVSVIENIDEVILEEK